MHHCLRRLLACSCTLGRVCKLRTAGASGAAENLSLAFASPEGVQSVTALAGPNFQSQRCRQHLLCHLG